jgi:hypothetical protein
LFDDERAEKKKKEFAVEIETNLIRVGNWWDFCLVWK